MTVTAPKAKNTLPLWVEQSTFTTNEDNIVIEQLLDDTSNDQAVDGSVTPVEFKGTVVPAGKQFVCQRILLFMEGATAFSSELFGDLTALTNGWCIEANGSEVICAKDNKTLAQLMFDLQGVDIFGKTTRTMVGRFSFSKICGPGNGLVIEAGNHISTIVKDNLSGLTYLEAMVQGYYRDIPKS